MFHFRFLFLLLQNIVFAFIFANLRIFINTIFNLYLMLFSAVVVELAESIRYMDRKHQGLTL